MYIGKLCQKAVHAWEMYIFSVEIKDGGTAFINRKQIHIK